MIVVFQFIYSFFATLGFAIYFRAPLGSVIASGVSGGFSWTLYYLIVYNFDNKILATLAGAFLVGIIVEVLAINYKKPATIFITPGIIPLVPGSWMYYTMSHLVNLDFNKAIAAGVEVFFLAAAIAIGIILSTIFIRIIKTLLNSVKVSL